MIIKKFLKFFEKIDGFLNRETAPQTPQYTIKLSNIILTPLTILCKNFKIYVRYCAVLALIMTIFSFFMHKSLGCGLSDTYPFSCRDINSLGYIVFLLIRLFIITLFARIWYNLIFNANSNYNINIFRPSVIDFKLYGTVILFLLINILPVFSLFLLIQRIPNPDWKIESIYFAVVSCGFWLPIIAIRFYSIPAFILSQEHIPNIKTIFKLTAGNGLKLLLSVSMMLLLCFLIIIYYLVLAQKLMPINYVLFGVILDFLYNTVILAISAIIINYCVCVKYQIFNDEYNLPG